jgi:hypothetical protein
VRAPVLSRDERPIPPLQGYAIHRTAVVALRDPSPLRGTRSYGTASRNAGVWVPDSPPLRFASFQASGKGAEVQAPEPPPVSRMAKRAQRSEPSPGSSRATRTLRRSRCVNTIALAGRADSAQRAEPGAGGKVGAHRQPLGSNARTGRTLASKTAHYAHDPHPGPSLRSGSALPARGRERVASAPTSCESGLDSKRHRNLKPQFTILCCEIRHFCKTNPIPFTFAAARPTAERRHRRSAARER